MNLLVPKIRTGGSFYLIVIYFWNSKTISQLNFEFFVFMLVKQFWQYIMHLSLLTWGAGGESGETGQRPGIWQREPTHIVGNFIAKSQGRELLCFLRSQTPYWIGSCKILSYQSHYQGISRRIDNQRRRPLFLQGSVGIFLYTAAEENVTRYLFLSSPF